mmetsp:Transcript_29404/g.94528  ORF Transcript_29404/g.94528 Transcript_29404/m.94528 type:complete len:220 (-) Transcript_29404:258-917(-)
MGATMPVSRSAPKTDSGSSRNQTLMSCATDSRSLTFEVCPASTSARDAWRAEVAGDTRKMPSLRCPLRAISKVRSSCSTSGTPSSPRRASSSLTPKRDDPLPLPSPSQRLPAARLIVRLGSALVAAPVAPFAAEPRPISRSERLAPAAAPAGSMPAAPLAGAEPRVRGGEAGDGDLDAGLAGASPASCPAPSPAASFTGCAVALWEAARELAVGCSRDL